jgi:hypothetical protein
VTRIKYTHLKSLGIWRGADNPTPQQICSAEKLLKLGTKWTILEDVKNQQALYRPDEEEEEWEEEEEKKKKKEEEEKEK